MDTQDIQNRFMHHPPVSQAVADAHTKVRGECVALAYRFNDMLPEGREKSLAITKLEEVMFWANAAIAREGN